jgi:stage II sporulation protein P
MEVIMLIQQKSRSFSKGIWLFIFPLFFAFLAPLIIINSSFFSVSKVGSHVSFLSSEQLFTIVSGENHYFKTVLPAENEASMLKLGAEYSTSIRFDDIRSLLGTELPGLLTYHSHILVAGTGTNYTNVPIESAPPMEVLLQERDIAQEQLQQLLNGEETVKTPANPTSKEKIFIYHTHSYESYFPLLGMENVENADLASDSKTNILLIGDLLGKKLEAEGIQTIVDKTNMGEELKKRDWTVSKAYQVSREIVESAIAGNEKPTYFLDLHRDSWRKEKTTVTINNEPYAKVAFVIGEENKNFDQNAAFALKLHEYLKEHYPGLSRGLIGKSGDGVDGVYNQDISPNSIIIEVGGVDNNMNELKNTVNALAEAVSDYYWEAEKVNATN